MEELTATQIGARLGVSERTAQRYIKSGRLKASLQSNGYYLVDPTDIDALKLPTLPTVTSSASALADILIRLERLEQQVRQLEDILRAFSPQTPHIPLPSKQPLLASQDMQKGASEALIWLTPGLVAWRSFCRVHGISETTVHKAIASGRVPVVEGSWRIGKTSYTLALDSQGRKQFYALFHNNSRFIPCFDCPH